MRAEGSACWAPGVPPGEGFQVSVLQGKFTVLLFTSSQRSPGGREAGGAGAGARCVAARGLLLPAWARFSSFAEFCSGVFLSSDNFRYNLLR